MPAHLDAPAGAIDNAARRFSGLLGQRPRPQAGHAAAAPCALRIVAGLHRGAMLRLREATLLGSDADNDIVLCDPDVKARHAELRRVDGVWGLYDRADGSVIAAFEVGRRGRFVRQRHALGAAQLVISQAMPLDLTPASRPSRFGRLLAPALLVLAASLGAAVLVQVVTPASAGIVDGSRRLAAEGWPDVELVAAPNAPLTARGYVDDAASLAHLRRWLTSQHLGHAMVVVRTGAELAARVRDALVDTGLAVDYQGGGSVRVQGSSTRMAVRERLRRITADLAGVVRIDDRVAFVEVPDLTPKTHVLPMRIVDVRPGNADNGGSFGAENGARYFVGGVLPDGSEVLAIGEDSIEFSMNGRLIHYRLQ